MKVGSLFSGIGGMDLGLERAGMEVVWQVEIDPYCRSILEKHWPDVRRYGDVKEIDPADLESVDLICGGFPCQPASQAGKRKGTSDERWLWPEFNRIIRGVGPRWVLVENVPGLLSVNSGRAFGEVLRDLAGGGYDAEWDCIPAAAVGAPHLRYRLFLIAHQRSDTDGHGCHDDQGQADGDRQWVSSGGDVEGLCEDVADADQLGSQRWVFSGERPRELLARTCCETQQGCWKSDAGVRRLAHGISQRVDRLKALGNAVVPQVAEWIGSLIMSV